MKRFMKLCVAVGALTLAVGTASAQEAIRAGDSLTVAGDNVKVMLGTKVLGNISNGQTIQAVEVRRGWVGTAVEVNGQKLNGWIWNGNLQAERTSRRRFSVEPIEAEATAASQIVEVARPASVQTFVPQRVVPQQRGARNFNRVTAGTGTRVGRPSTISAGRSTVGPGWGTAFGSGAYLQGNTAGTR